MDDFSDDDLDTLNPHALQELENTAIQLTQAQKTSGPRRVPDPATVRAPASTLLGQREFNYDYEHDYEDDDLDDTVVEVYDAIPTKSAYAQQSINAPVNETPLQLPSRVTTLQQQLQQQQPWRPVSVPHQPKVHPGRPGPSMPRPAAGASSIAFRGSQSIPLRGQVPTYSQLPRPPPPLPRPVPSTSARYQSSQAQRQNGPSSHEIAALEAQILDLKSKLNTKDGEISIIRKRLEKTREDYERELQVIKAQTAEQLAKQERLVDAARAAQESAATELQFTRRDLREEIDRAKRQDGRGTPKKKASAGTWDLADGFEDVEMAGSPTKGQRGKKAGPVASSIAEPPSRLLRTPTKNKRKRPAIDSPVMALETHSDDVVMLDEGSTRDLDVTILPNVSSSPFDYLKVILNHSSAHGRPLTFDYLSSFALPSRPSESLASILLTKLSTAGDPHDPYQLPIQFCLEVIRLWDLCRKEDCLAPITGLVSLVLFSLELHTVAIAPHIASPLLTVAMDACYEVAIPRFNSTSGDPTDEAFIKLRDNIDTSKILSLLYLTALGCATSEPVGGSLSSPAVDFWDQVHLQFVLMLLIRKQPIEDLVGMLKLLWTSVFSDSIGPINPGKTPEEVARLLIDRISIQLIETPRTGTDQRQLRDMRLVALQTLSAFARSPFGLAQLARHDWLIPRLVTLLSCCVDELYDGDMQYSLTGKEVSDRLQQMVMHIMLLLHLLVTGPLGGNCVDVSAKLSKTTGGNQKYLLSLSRLNFTDDLVPEATAELAHELLELAVTPEAGEELGDFFSG
ncbi:hypothetical protein F5Y17DRAFT_429026 [Xylariaceae sp. FL0594]|nr:hypothetical protein F5Y17DRAFT_429026 [Xylariaceae sp. FL0594]